MRFSIVFAFFILAISFAQAQQKQAAWWYTGSRKMDFNSGNPIDYEIQRGGRPLSACASISDKNGNLLLWCDGFSILNKNNLFLRNGYNLINNRANVPFSNDLVYDSTNQRAGLGGFITKAGFCEYPGYQNMFVFFYMT
jgi:hypothetical protein